MKQSPRRRNASKLPGSIQARLNMYTLAASAAGVGMLALAQPSEDKIVYTKVHQVIGANSSATAECHFYGKTNFSFNRPAVPNRP
jgi:hypothetical protein